MTSLESLDAWLANDLTFLIVLAVLFVIAVLAGVVSAALSPMRSDDFNDPGSGLNN
jgi:hypothetical protein